MSALVGRARSHPAVLRVTTLVVACAALVVASCRQPAYEAGNLPAELAAPPVANLDEIDLSRLGVSSVGSRVIDGGDLLEISIWTDYDAKVPLPMPIRVADDGAAHVPPIGRVHVAGLRPEAAEQAIAQAGIDRQVYLNPHVTVEIKEQRSNRVIVAGAVEKPGSYEIPCGNSTLLAALVEAGGLSKDAGPDIEIRSPAASAPRLSAAGQTGVQAASFDQSSSGQSLPSPLATERVNLVEATRNGIGNYPLPDGAAVMVTKRAPRLIRVMGLVFAPGAYEIPANQDVYLLDALAMAGGRKSEIADRVMVIRRLPHRPEPDRIQVSIREAKENSAANIRLAAGDLVTVEETPLTFALETIKTFFRVSVGGSMGTLF